MNMTTSNDHNQENEKKIGSTRIGDGCLLSSRGA
jgi:hypothetical protein